MTFGGGQRELVVGARQADRLAFARQWLAARGRSAEVVVVGATMQSAAELTRAATLDAGSSFGWHRTTLARLAWSLAGARLASLGQVPVSSLALEAVAARAVHAATLAGSLGRFEPIADRPGLPRALARTFRELREAQVHPNALGDDDLARLFDACVAELDASGLADVARLYEVATSAVQEGPTRDQPLLLLDVPLESACEVDFVRALGDASRVGLATVAAGDVASLKNLAALGWNETALSEKAASSALTRLAAGLFDEAEAELADPDESVAVFSAPGESRECVEIVRRIHREAERGVPFDRMAVVLRSPRPYRAHLMEAFRRGSVPVYFARGATRPDPAGRAFLALLNCAATGLPASRFAEFLSLGEVAASTSDDAPPPPRSSEERWTPADDGVLAEATLGEDEPDEQPREVDLRTARAPRLWERLLVDAAVIGGLDRWERRLHGLRRQLEVELAEHDDPDDGFAAAKRVAIDGVGALASYALPLLADLGALPRQASWGEWLDHLEAIATRALRRPERVLAVLAELRPMASVGPVGLREVRLVLERRLHDVSVPPMARRYGRVFVASTEDVRGLSFDVVFVPGLAEKLFPVRVVEDPVLPDRVRRGSPLPTNHERAARERLALRLAVGAAERRLVLSYPRLDVDQARPRTPSFYGLEILRAAEGTLPGFDDLSRRADVTGAVRLGWPAPADPRDAIDAAEHDLSRLKIVLDMPPERSRGRARYLLDANPHLARALRFREKRWRRSWTDADGLVELPAEATAALAAHRFDARSYSPTGLQHYAACPYRFVLSAIHKLAPRAEPTPLEELDALQRGSLIHETQFALLTKLRDDGLLPVTPSNLDAARALLDACLDAVAARYEDELAPAIARVWDDGIATIRADLREWLRRASLDPTWRPAYFELSFGLAKERASDPNSRAEPAALDCGIVLRGSMDLVERDGAGSLRATDHKTGKAKPKPGMVIDGGTVLQPVLYALTLEKLFPGELSVEGRLYFCTSRGDFTAVPVPLDDEARESAGRVARAVGDGLTRGFLPAAPATEACRYCDYLSVCGPHEESRVKRKPADELLLLHHLREAP